MTLPGPIFLAGGHASGTAVCSAGMLRDHLRGHHFFLCHMTIIILSIIRELTIGAFMGHRGKKGIFLAISIKSFQNQVFPLNSYFFKTFLKLFHKTFKTFFIKHFKIKLFQKNWASNYFRETNRLKDSPIFSLCNN